MVTTNGFDFDKVYDALKNRVRWQSLGVDSDSKRYYEDFHPLNDSNILDSVRPQTGDNLATYLANENRAVILGMLNAVYNAPQIIDQTQQVFFRGQTLLYPQPVLNMDQFVGLRLILSKGDFAIRCHSLELFFDRDVTFTMYLYNDLTLAPVYEVEVTAEAYNQVIVDLSSDAILSYLTPSRNKGGIWYFGYYQSDLGDAKALYYPINQTIFSKADIWAFSAQRWTDPNGDRNFNRNIIGANNLTYGLNLEVSTYRDATNNIVQNAGLFDELIGLSMAVRSVNNIIYSYRTNATQRGAQGNYKLGDLYAELNGFKADDELPYILGLKDKVNREIKRVKGSFQSKPLLHVGVANT